MVSLHSSVARTLGCRNSLDVSYDCDEKESAVTERSPVQIRVRGSRGSPRSDFLIFLMFRNSSTDQFF